MHRIICRKEQIVIEQIKKVTKKMEFVPLPEVPEKKFEEFLRRSLRSKE